MKSQIAVMKNVVLHEDDVTGGLIAEVWKKAGHRTFINKLRSLASIEVSEYQPRFDPGLIVSLNIITQLESLLVRVLKKKSLSDEVELEDFRRRIQMKHISFLLKHRSILITDITEVETETSGRTKEIRSLLVDLPESEHTRSWTWQFDTGTSDYYTKKSVFKVTALIL
jgi:hypothetical protein